LSTVDLAAGTVTHETVDYVHRDFPRVHPRREGRPTKYTYVAASPHLQEGEPFFPFQCIQKVALDGSGRTLTWRPSKPGCFVGEPVVAPRPGAVNADDAWLLVVVHDVHAAATDLVVLDARTLAVATELRVDRLLPLGLHGTWA
jgi:carotenoid cleavage dioxygenase-like enzyme